jgi:hypothetical protein
MNSLRSRLQKIENATGKGDGGITVRFACVHILPPSYVGERHEVLVRGYPSADPGNDCLIREVEGPGPKLEFDFPDANGRRVMLVRFVGTDGDGHPTGDLPNDIAAETGKELN